MSDPLAQRDKRPAPAAAAQAPSERLLRQMRVLWRADRRWRHRTQRLAGLGGTQLAALAAIRAQPGIGVNALAAQLDVRQPTASNLVHGLSQRALVQRLPAGNDRRAVCLHTTRAGEAVLAPSPVDAAGALESAMRRLDPVLLRRLEQALARLIAAIGNSAGQTDDRRGG